MILVLSVFSWQSESIPYQFLLQILVLSIISFYVFKAVFCSKHQKQTPIIFSQGGEWLETSIDGQVAWRITDKSRVSGLLLFIHLISPLNIHHSKWCLVYIDQVTKRDFRRLCRAVIYQQQTAGKD
ncbi:MAG: hypothetical protein ACJAXM_000456 [Arenicella sp.]|jgi:hypothetical protein